MIGGMENVSLGRDKILGRGRGRGRYSNTKEYVGVAQRVSQTHR